MVVFSEISIFLYFLDIPKDKLVELFGGLLQKLINSTLRIQENLLPIHNCFEKKDIIDKSSKNEIMRLLVLFEISQNTKDIYKTKSWEDNLKICILKECWMEGGNVIEKFTRIRSELSVIEKCIFKKCQPSLISYVKTLAQENLSNQCIQTFSEKFSKLLTLKLAIQNLVLTTFNKIVEKILHRRIVSFTDDYIKRIYKRPFGYRRKSSTETAALEMISEIQKEIDGQSLISLAFDKTYVENKKMYEAIGHFLFMREGRKKQTESSMYV